MFHVMVSDDVAACDRDAFVSRGDDLSDAPGHLMCPECRPYTGVPLGPRPERQWISIPGDLEMHIATGERSTACALWCSADDYERIGPLARSSLTPISRMTPRGARCVSRTRTTSTSWNGGATCRPDLAVPAPAGVQSASPAGRTPTDPGGIMSTTNEISAVRKAVEEMTAGELRAEVVRLRRELSASGMPHPAMWANAEKIHANAKDHRRYYHLPDSAKRAIEILGYLIDIRNWPQTQSQSQS